jgi:hypothetical protein
MSASQMCVEDRLAGASNWLPWKARMVFFLEDLNQWDIVKVVVPVIPITSLVLVAEFKKGTTRQRGPFVMQFVIILYPI